VKLRAAFAFAARHKAIPGPKDSWPTKGTGSGAIGKLEPA